MKEEYYDQAVACVKDHVLPAQRELYTSCGGDFDKVYGEAMNGNGYFGKVIVPGHVYELGYEKCTCEKVLSGQITDPDHCNCSKQSILYILRQLEPESIFDVEILETVLQGADHCRFRITKNEFFITGADATGCVKSTCFNMTKAGYAVHVISDCVTSYAPKKLPEMLRYYADKGSEVRPLGEYQGMI